MGLRGSSQSSSQSPRQDYCAQSQTRQSSQPNWTIPNVGKRKNRRLFWLMRGMYCFIMFVCGVLIAFSAAPWGQAGLAISSTVLELDFWKALESIPLLGLVAMLIRWMVGGFMPLLLWGLVQLIEVTPILTRDPEIYEGMIQSIKTWNVKVTDDDTVAGKMQNKLAKFIPSLLRDIGIYAAIAYVAEVVVNVWHYVPYGGGWNAFISDMWVWDAANIQWVQFFMMLGSIGIVELLVLFMLKVHQLFKYITPRPMKKIG